MIAIDCDTKHHGSVDCLLAVLQDLQGQIGNMMTADKAENVDWPAVTTLATEAQQAYLQLVQISPSGKMGA